MRLRRKNSVSMMAFVATLSLGAIAPRIVCAEQSRAATVIAAAVSREDAQPPVDEAKLRGEISRAAKDDQVLRGSWATVEFEADKSFTVTLWVDANPERRKPQEDAWRKLIHQYAGKDFNNFHPTKVIPVTQFLERLRLECEEDWDLNGIRIDYAFFYPRTPTELGLRLVGTAIKADLTEKLTNLCADKLVEEVFGSDIADLLIVNADPVKGMDDGMLVFPRSEDVAAKCYSLGIQQFIKKNYADAMCLFTRAMHEAPERLDIRYWRVGMMIGMKQTKRAEDTLKRMWARDQKYLHGYYKQGVAVPLENLSGGIRIRLTQMVDETITSCSLASLMAPPPPIPIPPPVITDPKPVLQRKDCCKF